MNINIDNIMRDYVKFICNYIPENFGASVSDTSGFPMKGNWIPVKVKILDILSRSAEFEIESLGFKKTFIFYMSRHIGPEPTIHNFGKKVNETVLEIIQENNLDRHQIFLDHNLNSLALRDRIKLSIEKDNKDI